MREHPGIEPNDNSQAVQDRAALLWLVKLALKIPIYTGSAADLAHWQREAEATLKRMDSSAVVRHSRIGCNTAARLCTQPG